MLRKDIFNFARRAQGTEKTLCLPLSSVSTIQLVDRLDISFAFAFVFVYVVYPPSSWLTGPRSSLKKSNLLFLQKRLSHSRFEQRAGEAPGFTQVIILELLAGLASPFMSS